MDHSIQFKTNKHYLHSTSHDVSQSISASVCSGLLQPVCLGEYAHPAGINHAARQRGTFVEV